jgi:hypothetical protein
VAETFCEAGVVPPVWYEKVSVVGLSVKLGVEDVTLNVTAMVCGLLLAPVAVTVTVPLYVPAARPEVFTPTLTLPGVVPLVGVAVSHAADVAIV